MFPVFVITSISIASLLLYHHHYNTVIQILMLMITACQIVTRDPSLCLNAIQEASKDGEEGPKVNKIFYINVPQEYFREVEQVLMEKVGCKFEYSREHYHVKVLIY